MKIVCIEEHTVDAATAQASKAAQQADAPYMADLGSRVQGTPRDVPTDRPSHVPPAEVMKLAKDVGPGRIAEMDRHGIDMQVLSYSTPSQRVPASQAVALARDANDRLAEAIQVNPARFGGFATLPWQDPDAAARELERAVSQLGLRGSLLIGRPGDTFLDDAMYEPVLAAFDQLRAPLYVHPGPPLPQVQAPYYGGLDKEVSARLSLFGWGWHHEAGVHVLRMILSGRFEKFPNLQVISGHWGEMVPFYLQRLDDAIPQEATGLPRTISRTYREHVHVTPSGMLTLPHFEFIHKVVGVDRIIFSVDYPYLTNTGARRFLERLPVSDGDRAKIAHRNAEALFRLG